uniref:SpoIID/LytB domain-containing protein n=1 Tax=Pygmaiobacter massiliensis TaxID=1917873 RepID=UPI0011AF5AA2
LASFTGSTEFGNICAKFGIPRGSLPASTEARDQNLSYNLFVQSLFSQALHRLPSDAEMNNWVANLLTNSMSVKQLTGAIVFSAEAKNNTLSERDYIALIYNILLGRAPSDEEIATWTPTMSSWTGRQSLINQIASSSEASAFLSARYGLTGGADFYSGSQLTVTFGNTVVTDSSVNILARVVAGEVGGFRNAEVYRAQAIAAHAWIIYQQAHGNPAPTVTDGTPTKFIYESIAEVADLTLTYNGQPVLAQYTASTGGGWTNSAASVGWGDLPYLVPVESKYDYLSSSYKQDYIFDLGTMKNALNRIYDNGIPQWEPIDFSTDPAGWLSYNPNAKGYAGTLNIQIKRSTSAGVSGVFHPTANYFKENSKLGLRSADYIFAYNPNQTWTFTTFGFGHGVGMSQWGAYGYATQEGWNYRQILLHYYSNVSIVSV